MSNSFTSVFGASAGGTDATKLPLTGGTLTGALTLPNAIFSGLLLTGAQATNTINLSTTWETTGNPTLIYGRVTNTASGSTANLIDLGTVAGGSLFSVSKAGLLTASTGVFADLRFQAGTVGSIINLHGGDILFKSNDAYPLKLYGATKNIVAHAAGGFGFCASGDPYSGDADTVIRRAALRVFQLGNSLVSGWLSQTLAAAGGRIGTDVNNSPTNTLTIAGSISTGTGTGGDLRLGVYGTNGTSGSAIGTLNTILAIIAARKVINISNIPTASTGVSGDVYSNAGVLMIVP